MARLGELPWTEARDAFASGAVALLPVGAVEAHGPHLPLATDVIIAEAMAREAASRLAARGIRAVILPSVAYSVARYAAAFPGTVSVGPATAEAVLADIARALSAQGVRMLAIANAHLEPAHIATIAAASARIRKEGGLEVVFPDVTRHGLAKRLTEEFRSGACHAGQYEGSIVMAERPDLVREDIRKTLPPNPASLVEALRQGKKTFEEAGGPQAYFGNPAGASSEEGRETVKALGALLEEAVATALVKVPEGILRAPRPPMPLGAFHNLLLGGLPILAAFGVQWALERWDAERLLATYVGTAPMTGWKLSLAGLPGMLIEGFLLSFLPAWAVLRLGTPRGATLALWVLLLPSVLACVWAAAHFLPA